MPVAQLSIDLVAKVASFENGLKRAARATEEQSNRIGKALGVARNGFAGLAAGFSVGFLANFIKETNTAIDALNDVSDASGASIENISALEDVARRTGGSLETVSGILVKFNQVLSSADPDSRAAKSLAAIGLSAKELQKLDPAEALRQTAVALAQFADDGEKARLVQDLFGKSVREAAPFLKDLAEQGKLNATVTTEQALAAEKFNKQLFALQTEASNAARALVGKLIPALSQVFKDVATFSQKSSLAGLAGDVISLKKQLDLLESRKSSGFNLSGNLDAEISKTRAKLQEAKNLFNAADKDRPKSAGAGRGFVIPEFEKPKIEIPPDAVKVPKTPRVSSGGGRSGKTQEDREAEEQRRRDLAVGELRNKLAGERFAERIRNEEALDRVIADVIEKEERRLQILLDDTPTQQLEKQRETMQFLAQAFEDGKISAEQFNEAATSALGDVATQAQKADSFVSDLGLSFTSAFEDAITEGKKFSEVLKGLEQDILRILTRKLVTQPLDAAISGLIKGSGGGDIFGTLLSSILGGAPGKAVGGPVSAGGLYQVNERGPELLNVGNRQFLMMGNQSGSVTPNSAISGSKSVNIVNNFNVPATVDRRTREQIGAMAGTAIQRAMARNG